MFSFVLCFCYFSVSVLVELLDQYLLGGSVPSRTDLDHVFLRFGKRTQPWGRFHKPIYALRRTQPWSLQNTNTQLKTYLRPKKGNDEMKKARTSTKLGKVQKIDFPLFGRYYPCYGYDLWDFFAWKLTMVTSFRQQIENFSLSCMILCYN